MTRPFLILSLSGLILTPSLAAADTGCHAHRSNNRVLGTVIGAGLGALFGNAVSEHGGKPGGTIIGGIGGGVAGNLIAGSGTKCNENRYGYYDQNGSWMPNTSNAEGYYDANGQWTRYSANTPSVNQTGQNDGYYDNNGQWVEQRQSVNSPPPGNTEGYWRDGDSDTRQRESWLDRRFREAMAQGRVGDRDGRRALRELADLRNLDNDYRTDDGRLDPEQQAYIDHRLERLKARLERDERVSQDGPRGN